MKDDETLETEADVDVRLNTDVLPNEIKNPYNRILDEMEASRKEPTVAKALRTFDLLLVGRKPLSSSSFLDAVHMSGSSPDGRLLSTRRQPEYDEVASLVRSCRGLVVHEEATDVFRFFHPSVDVFLRDRKMQAQAHHTMAVACLNVLRMSDKPAMAGRPPARLERGRSPIRALPGPSSMRMASRSLSRTSSAGSLRSNSGGPVSRSGSRSGSRHGSHRGSPPASPGGSRPISRSGNRAGISKGDDSPGEDSEEDDVAGYYYDGDDSEGDDSTGDGDEDSELADSEGTTNELGDLANTLVGSTRWPGPGRRMAMESQVPIQDFEEYAAIYMATHFTLCRGDAGNNAASPYKLARFLQRESSDWIPLVQRLLSQRPIGFYDRQVERELEQCLSVKPTGLFASCVYGFADIARSCVRSLEARLGKPHLPDSSISKDPMEGALVNSLGLSAAHIAAMFGRVEVLEMLAKEAPKVQGYWSWSADENGKTALEYALESATDGTMVDEILKIDKLAELRWKPGVAIAAMGNPTCSESLMTELYGLDYGDMDQIELSPEPEKLLIAAVTSPYRTIEVITHLCMPTRRAQGNQVLVAAAGWTSPVDSLLGKSNPAGDPPSGVGDGAQESWESTHSIWSHLLDDIDETLVDWEMVIVAAIYAEDVDLVAYLLRKAKLTTITSSMLRAVVSSRRRPHDLLDQLVPPESVEVKVKVELTWKVVGVALQNPLTDERLLRRLLGWRKRPRKITNAMLISMAKNRERGTDLLRVCLEAKNVVFTEDGGLDVINAAMANANRPFLEAIFKEHGNNLSMDEMIFERLVLDLRNGRDDLEGKYAGVARSPLTMLEGWRPEEEWDREMADIFGYIIDLIDDFETLVVQSTTLDAVSHFGPHVHRLLLRRTGYPMTESLILAATANKVYGQELLRYLVETTRQEGLRLLDPPGNTRDDRILKAVVRQGTLQMLLYLLRNRSPLPQELGRDELKILCSSAAQNPDVDVVRYVFGKVLDVEEFHYLTLAAKTSDATLGYLMGLPILQKSVDVEGWRKLLRVVAKHCCRTSSMEAAAGKAPLEAYIDDAMAEDLLRFAVANERTIDMATYILTRFPLIRVSSEMLDRAASNSGMSAEMLRVLFNRCDDASLQMLIRERTLIAAAGNGTEAPEALYVLLNEPGVPEMVTESVWEAARENEVARTETLSVLNHFCAPPTSAKGPATKPKRGLGPT